MEEERHTERIVGKSELLPGCDGQKRAERIIDNLVEFAYLGELVLARTDNEFDLVNHDALLQTLVENTFLRYKVTQFNYKYLLRSCMPCKYALGMLSQNLRVYKLVLRNQTFWGASHCFRVF